MLRTLTRTITAIAVVAALPACGGTDAEHQQATREEPATTAVLSWLSLVDAGKYDESWSTAADLFKSAMSEEAWDEAASNARGPLGNLVSRELQSAVYQLEPQGEAAGEYVLVKFSSTFENHGSKFEMVSSRLEADEAWRVSGYFIR